MAAAGLLIAAQPSLAAGKATHFVVASGTGSVPHESPGTGNESAVTGGALFGGNAALTGDSHKLGRHLAIIRIYDHIGDTFPGPDRTYLAAGSTALVSLDSNGTSYTAIAAGRQDKAITAFLTAVNRAATRYHLPAIYVSFEHEPDNAKHHALGTPAEFVKAWDHIHQLAAAHHLSWRAGGRLHWVWIVLHSSFSNGLASKFWPGVGKVAGVGVDGYNSLSCRVAKPGPVKARQRTLFTPAAIFDPAIAFAHAKGGVPVFIAGWGSDGTPAAQATFIRQMQTYITHNRQIAAAMYWDSNGPTCHYSLDRNPASLAALTRMGHSRALQGHTINPQPGCGTWWAGTPATPNSAAAAPVSAAASNGATPDGATHQTIHACPFRLAPTGAACWRATPMTSESGVACARLFRMSAPIHKSSH
ncbi:MAG TPA: hypothetical protein VGI74_26550 [Streptosporangiaceae bacterium]